MNTTDFRKRAVLHRAVYLAGILALIIVGYGFCGWLQARAQAAVAASVLVQESSLQAPAR
jgi:S-adenosylhomocysteine hydrolase